MERTVRKNILALLLVLAVTFLVFFPSLNNGFTNWDDDVHLTQNRLVRSLDLANIRHIFTTVINLTYIPLTTLSFALEYHFFGLDPFVYHLDNLLLHLAVTSLVYFFALRMGASSMAAFIAALLFGIHPMRVESVVWVTERKDVLFGLFFMLALVEYQSYLREKRRAVYLRILLWATLSVLSKSMAVTLPLALLVCDVFYRRRDIKTMLLEKVPFLFVMTPLTCITYTFNSQIMMPHTDLWKAVLIFAKTFSFYLEKFFCPVLLVPNYALPQPVSLGQIQYVFSFLLTGAIVWLVVRCRKDPWVVFAAAFYGVTIFIILRTGDQHVKGVVADRFMYIPSVGLCILMGVLWDRFHRIFITGNKYIRLLFLVLFVGGISGLCFKTYTQSLIWKDSLTLWDYVIAHTSEKAFIFNNRGTAYLNQKQYDKALTDFNKAIELDPHNDDAFYNRGQVYKHQGKTELALADFNRAITISPNFADAYNNLGSIYEEQGQLETALNYYTTSVKVDPYLDKGYSNRGAVFVLKERYDLALADFDRALKINPGVTSALINRGILYRLQKKYDLALRDLDQVLANGPNEKAYINRGIVYGYKERFDLALIDFAQALNMNPDNVMVYAYRGIVLFNQGKLQEAVADFTEVLKREPDNVKAYRYRINAYGRLKDDALAIKDLDQMIRLKPKDGRNYFNRSVCYRNLGKYDKAYEDLLRSAQNGYHPHPSYINSLRALLRLKEF